MDVLIKTSTSINKSPTKLPNINQDSNTIQLHQLQTAANFQQITTTVKAIHLDEPIAIAGNNYKQDVTIAVSTATARFTLWETDIGKIEANTSYILLNVMVQTYQHIKYLTLPKVQQTEDVGIVQDSPPTHPHLNTPVHSQIVAVPQLTLYKACIACNSKVE